MEIIVCVKQVQAVYARTGQSPATLFLNPEDTICRVNPYDEAAMTLAVKIKAAVPGTHITVVAMAPMTAEDDVWRIMGMGGDRLCRIDPSSLDQTPRLLDSWAKARVLSQAAKTLKADLVLCGKESMDRRNGLVAAYMAHMMNLPLATAILDLQISSLDRPPVSAEEGSVGGARITKNIGRGRREIVDCSLPALFSVDLSNTPPLMPAYAAIAEARRREVIRMVYDADTLAMKTYVVAIHTARPRPKPLAAPASTLPSYQRVKQLLSGSAIQKKGRTITGSPGTQVDEIIAFLQEHDLLPDLSADKSVD